MNEIRTVGAVGPGNVIPAPTSHLNYTRPEPFGGFGRSSGKDAPMASTRTRSVWVEAAATPGVAFGYVG